MPGADSKRRQPIRHLPSGVPLSYALTRLSRAIGHELQSANLTLVGPQVAALLALRHEPGLSNAQLSRRCYVTPQSMNEVILVLEQRGLIVRRQDPSNRRILRAELTPAATDILAGWDDAIADVEARMFDGFTSREIDTFAAALDECVANMGIGR